MPGILRWPLMMRRRTRSSTRTAPMRASSSSSASSAIGSRQYALLGLPGGYAGLAHDAMHRMQFANRELAVEELPAREAVVRLWLEQVHGERAAALGGRHEQRPGGR